jgi:hypothetical protein
MAIVTFQYPPAPGSTLPIGASTSALQTAGNASLASIDSKLSTPMPVSGPLTDAQLRAIAVPVSGSFYPATQPVSIASSVAVTGPLTDIELRATAVPVSLASNPLPTGASTSALQTAGNASLASIDTKLTSPLAVTGPLTNTELRLSAVPVSLASTTVTGSVAVTGPLTDTQLRAAAVPVSMASTAITGSVAVTGPLTNTELRATAVPVSLASTTVTGSVAVTGTFWQTTQPVSLATTPASTGRSKANAPVRLDYTGTNVTTAAYVQLVASTTSTANQLEIFDSSGEALILAVGAAASEVDQFYILPGGNGKVELSIPAASRVSIKALTATASSGYIIVNFYT